jgi:hypothetical protein
MGTVSGGSSSSGGGGFIDPSSWVNAAQGIIGTNQNVVANSTTNESNSSTNAFDLSTIDVATRGSLNQFIAGLMANFGVKDSQYTKDKAIADSSGVVDSIFKKFKEVALPQIYTAQNQSGGYNSTGAQQLADSAYGQATADSASVVLDTINKYGTLHQGLLKDTMTSLIDAFGVAKGSVQQGSSSVTGKTDTTNKSTQKTTSPGTGGSIFGTIGNLLGF